MKAALAGVFGGGEEAFLTSDVGTCGCDDEGRNEESRDRASRDIWIGVWSWGVSERARMDTDRRNEPVM